MPDLHELNRIITDSGINRMVLSKKAKMSRATLYKKLNGKSEFKASEIANMSKVLHLSTEQIERVFFG